MSGPAALPSPLELLELSFLRSALAELVLLAIAGGLLGAFVVLRRLAFFSHAVGTASFPGLVVAEAAGFSPALAGLAVGMGYAGAVGRVQGEGRDPGAVPTALLLVTGLALGTVLASDVLDVGGAVDGLLFGTLLGVGAGDLALSAGAASLAAAGVLLLGRTWAATGFDPDGAAALAPAGRRADLLLLGLLALAIAAAIPAVGALLVTALFVVPASTARLLTASVGGLLAASAALAAGEGVAGLYLAWALDVPPGPAIAVLGAIVFALTAAAGRRGRQ